MKRIYLILAFALTVTVAKAQVPDQQPQQLSEEKQQNIEALKVAFLSKELELTPAEAEKFWPVYNQYSKEMKGIKPGAKDDEDVLGTDQKVLDLRMRYKDQFTKLLGQPRMNKMFGAEKRFRQVLIKAMRHQQRLRNNPQNRPQLRRN